MKKILQKLKGGDLRSIGRADEVVEDVLEDQQLFEDVFEGILADDPVVAMRASDVVEKVSSKHPEYLQPYKDRLIREISKVERKEVRWHVAQMFSYLEVSKDERNEIIKILNSYIDSSDSAIVKTFSMQTLADFAKKDERIRSRILSKIEKLVETGSPAIVSRGKKLIDKLKEK
ncbi:hypothetical protein AKJ58_00370 [candidate division MSBL1 archaeon SCGC-AAA385D11]|uniref:Condensin complex subunit 1 C-terminal domain-containing protein n=1 Tax=candidate division MSBL1 archaeon SCGC-AAA385D11 TaxID=1698286 RepID=A0A133VPD0_9EURY|nr:hypothetical protein AKJ58_00370 [candidate division MSBL1 archaeon SCGC-AAA385D11]